MTARWLNKDCIGLGDILLCSMLDARATNSCTQAALAPFPIPLDDSIGRLQGPRENGVAGSRGSIDVHKEKSVTPYYVCPIAETWGVPTEQKVVEDNRSR